MYDFSKFAKDAEMSDPEPTKRAGEANANYFERLADWHNREARRYSSGSNSKKAQEHQEAATQYRAAAKRFSKDMATDPPVSQAQRAAMQAAAHGNSTLGIPAKVGKEFSNADPGGKLPAKK